MSTWTPAVGDRVKVGNGTKVWQIVELWEVAGTRYATMLPDGGYSRSSAALDRLTLIERAS